MSMVNTLNNSAAAQTVAQSLLPNNTAALPATAATATTPTSTTAASTGATITANDFLTLLVTEMKNQDPTQPTDPNAYIQQLVNVNSLQQLISINQDLTPSSTAPTTGASAATNVTSAVTGA